MNIQFNPSVFVRGTDCLYLNSSAFKAVVVLLCKLYGEEGVLQNLASRNRLGVNLFRLQDQDKRVCGKLSSEIATPLLFPVS